MKDASGPDFKLGWSRFETKLTFGRARIQRGDVASLCLRKSSESQMQSTHASLAHFTKNTYLLDYTECNL